MKLKTEVKEVFASLKEVHELDDSHRLISFEDSLKVDGAVHAVHCCIWSESDYPLVRLDTDKSQDLDKRAMILMHLRFDGSLGFGGGVVDEQLVGVALQEGQLVVAKTIQRELGEEINFDGVKHQIDPSNYLYSTIHSDVRQGILLILHFYVYQVSPVEILEIERRSLESCEHGRENFGNIRVPLYTMTANRGFPVFIKNRFAGTALCSLLFFLIYSEIMTKEEIQTAKTATPNLYIS